MDMSYLKDMPIAVLGGGAVGKTMAADCALAGKEVRIWDQPRFAKTNFLNIEKTGITLSGNQFSFFGYTRKGTAKVALATDDMAKAVKGAGIIIVATVAIAHEGIFRELIPLLEDGQVIHILPDNCGTLVFRKLMRELKCTKKVIVGSWYTAPYGIRVVKRGGVTTNECKVEDRITTIRGCALPTKDNEAFMASAYYIPAFGAIIDELNQLQPTGYGNPNPVLMARGLHVQEARRVGVGGAHLKLTLLDGANVRGGIGFQQGDLADRGYERVDVLFSPEVNEFRGQRTVQLNVAAMKQTGGSLLWPDEKMIFSALLQELTALASNYNTLSSGDAQAKILPLRTNQLREKLRLGRGVLMIAHQSAWAKDVLSGGEADTDVGQVRDARAFNTVLFAPDVEKLRDDWRDVVLLDGETLPGLKDIIRQKCPNARLWCLSDAPDDLRKQLSSMTVSEDTLRGLYRRLLRGGTMAASALAQDCGMTEEQVLTGLTVFGQVALVSFKLDPYQLTLLPMHKVALTDSPLRKYLITHYAAETQM